MGLGRTWWDKKKKKNTSNNQRPKILDGTAPSWYGNHCSGRDVVHIFLNARELFRALKSFSLWSDRPFSSAMMAPTWQENTQMISIAEFQGVYLGIWAFEFHRISICQEIAFWLSSSYFKINTVHSSWAWQAQASLGSYITICPLLG